MLLAGIPATDLRELGHAYCLSMAMDLFLP